MDTNTGKRKKGFTVIELMIVLVIVALLMALAYPSYVKYVRKAKRGEAQQMLMNWSVNQEIYRSNNTTYDDGTDIDEPCSQTGADCDYTFTVTGTSATAYTLTATAPSGTDQAKDKQGAQSCASMTLNQDGVKTPPACWQ
jgi:type IV pilus assembly protein PilE